MHAQAPSAMQRMPEQRQTEPKPPGQPQHAESSKGCRASAAPERGGLVACSGFALPRRQRPLLLPQVAHHTVCLSLQHSQGIARPSAGNVAITIRTRTALAKHVPHTGGWLYGKCAPAGRPGRPAAAHCKPARWALQLVSSVRRPATRPAKAQWCQGGCGSAANPSPVSSTLSPPPAAWPPAAGAPPPP